MIQTKETVRRNGRKIPGITAIRLALVTVASFSLADVASAQLPPKDQTNPPRKLDFGKAYIEKPMKSFFKSGEIPRKPIRDASKMGIEAPVKSMLRSGYSNEILKRLSAGGFVSPSVPPPAYTLAVPPVMVSDSDSNRAATKRTSMTTTAEAIGENYSTNSNRSSKTRPSHAVAPADKTSTGLVTWHTDMKNAMKQSEKSGKPLLVFHMMGMLDDRFC